MNLPIRIFQIHALISYIPTYTNVHYGNRVVISFLLYIYEEDITYTLYLWFYMHCFSEVVVVSEIGGSQENKKHNNFSVVNFWRSNARSLC